MLRISVENRLVWAEAYMNMKEKMSIKILKSLFVK